MTSCETREAITLQNNGEKIFAILHRPLSKGPVPAVVVCPGFGGNKCGKFRLFVTLGQALAKEGIAVLRFDYRGAGDSEGEFKDITLEGKISDTMTCLRFLENDPQIDPNRIGLLGRSLGGVISLLTAERHGNIKSLALWAPVFNSDPWRDLWKAFQSKGLTPETQSAIHKFPFGVPSVQFLTQFFQLDIPRTLESLKKVPLLHIHGEKDQMVTIEHAEGFKRSREGVDCSKFVRLQNCDHDFSDREEQLQAIQESVKWYVNTLK